MAHYDIVAVSRVPAQSAAPTLTELGPILIKEKFSYSEELVGEGFIALSVDIDNTPDVVVDRLRDLVANPTEIRIYREGTLIKQGVIIGVQQQGQTITLQCRGLLYYWRWMYVTADLIYQDIDQNVIAKGLLDHWQALDYGDLGFNTTIMGTSGVLRRRSFYRDELVNIGHAIEIMASADNGFDYYIDANRNVIIDTPRGSDLTSSVILDTRSIISTDMFLSGTSKVIGSMALAVGGGADNETPVYATAEDAQTLFTLGRLGVIQVFNGVKLQATIQSHADAMLSEVKQVTFAPGAETLFPIAGAGVGDFNVGDKVTWIFDSEIGEFNLARDIFKRIVNVDNVGEEQITVEFV